MALVIGVLMIGLLPAGQVASAASTPTRAAATPRATPTPVTVSGLSSNGHVRCTAEFPTSLSPGQDTGMQMFLKNRTSHKIHFGEGPSGRLEVWKNGAKLWESGLNYFPGPAPLPLDVKAHTTKRLSVDDVAVRWGGTLTLQPICSGVHIDLDTVALPVRVPGPTPTTGAALSAALAHMAGVFDGCAPTANTGGVDGTFPPPVGRRNLPPLNMHCWADVQQKAGFAVVDLHLVTPHDAPRVSLLISDTPTGNGVLSHKITQVVTWEFLVSASGTDGLGTFYVARIPLNRHAKSFEFSYWKGKWSRYAGRCGDEEISWGPEVSISLVWMNRCVNS